MHIKPLRDYIILEKLSAAESDIILPRKWLPKYRKGKVIALGSGIRDDKGNLHPFGVNIGDIVVVGQAIGAEWYMDGEKRLFIKPDQILFIVNPNQQKDSFFLKEE